MHSMTLFPELFSDVPVTKRLILRKIEARYSNEMVRENAPEWLTKKFSAPNVIFEMFSDLARETKEHFLSVHLDGKNRIVAFDRISMGSLNQSIVHPREVFKTALLSSSAAIVFIHNHPTGDPTPSNEDITITRRLKEAGDLLGIKVLDHIIIGCDYCSFIEKGLL